jgi:small subunit ribosomal protein S3
MSAVKNVMKNNFRNLELDEYLASTLKDAGYGEVDVQKTPIGTRITLYVTRPGLVIGRKGTGIKELTSRLEEKFGLVNPQISVLEVSVPELNPKIMCSRIAQLIERGTAFRRAAMWSMNTIMNAGALGVEIAIAGKLRSERAHFEKHSSGVMPKSGDFAERVVRIGTTSVLTKMGLMGIQLRIALKNELPQEFEIPEHPIKAEPSQPQTENSLDSTDSNAPASNLDTSSVQSIEKNKPIVASGDSNGQT